MTPFTTRSGAVLEHQWQVDCYAPMRSLRGCFEGLGGEVQKTSPLYTLAREGGPFVWFNRDDALRIRTHSTLVPALYAAALYGNAVVPRWLALWWAGIQKCMRDSSRDVRAETMALVVAVIDDADIAALLAVHDALGPEGSAGHVTAVLAGYGLLPVPRTP